jgi:hypothetical protein
MGAAMMLGARRTGSHDATNDGKRGCKQAAQKARPRISGRGRRQHGGQSDGKNQFSFAHDHLARQGQAAAMRATAAAGWHGYRGSPFAVRCKPRQASRSHPTA